ncbi:MAG TPA: hypothetical protein IAA76_02650 [Candidatus Ornithospirochaeta stercorigallinarum]|nr:hypothetical protein [Candidatus Ornithospirochaeta stercorigallinarum]
MKELSGIDLKKSIDELYKKLGIENVSEPVRIDLNEGTVFPVMAGRQSTTNHSEITGSVAMTDIHIVY